MQKSDAPHITVIHGETYFRLAYLGQKLQTGSLLYVDFEQRDWKLPQMKMRLLAEQQHQSWFDVAAVEYIALDGCDKLSLVTLQTFIQDMLATARHVLLFYEQLPLDFALDVDKPLQKQMITDRSVSPSVLPHTGIATFPIKIEALRRGHVYLGQSATRITDWRGQLQRDLLYFFADKKTVDRDVVLATFWEHLEPHKAANNFFVTIGKLTQLLGFKPIVRTGAKEYCLAPEIVLHYDVDDFIQALQAAMQSDSEARIVFLQKAIDLYRSSFLEGNTAAWASQRRQVLATMAVRALQMLAAYFEERQEWGKALSYLSRAFYIDSTDEEIVYSIIQLYSQQGLPCDAIKTYEQWQSAIKNQPGNFPGTDIHILAKQLYPQCP